MNAKFVKGISRKTGNEWYAVEVTLVDGYKKLIFLNNAEVLIVKQAYGNDIFDKQVLQSTDIK